MIKIYFFMANWIYLFMMCIVGSLRNGKFFLLRVTIGRSDLPRYTWIHLFNPHHCVHQIHMCGKL